MNLVKLLANNWQPIAIIALVGTLLAVSHHQGYKSAFAKQQAVIDKMEKDKAQALLLSAQNYARELEQARAEAKKYEVKAHAVGMALAKKQAEVSRLKTERDLCKIPVPPDSRNPNTGFQLFSPQIPPNSTQIPP
ncbi:hypothetical protein [Neisseria meningitidis]|uniref:hypothetical protein n=1 Tax=Neisseria meningitidis TaxID=487 RepID=UPI0010CAEE29|nr:hypothetical protein [Neisseria meningitidis]TKV54176.1 hypothetical protein EHH59_05950 [Neisseria meningitidis]